MRFAGLYLLLFLIAPDALAASTAEVRYVSIENNCPPKKIEVYNQKVGDQAEVTYRVECDNEKSVDETAKTASSIIIRCRYNLCSFVRPVLPTTEAQ